MEQGMEPSKHSLKNYGALHIRGWTVGLKLQNSRLANNRELAEETSVRKRRGPSEEQTRSTNKQPTNTIPKTAHQEAEPDIKKGIERTGYQVSVRTARTECREPRPTNKRPTKNKCKERRRPSAKETRPTNKRPARTSVRKDADRVRRKQDLPTSDPPTSRIGYRNIEGTDYQEKKKLRIIFWTIRHSDKDEAESDIEKSTSKEPIIKKRNNLHCIETQKFTPGNQMEEDPPPRSQEIEIAFSAASTSDEESSVLSSTDKESSVLSSTDKESSVLSSSSSSSSSSGDDNKKKYRYKMVVYTNSQVPKLDKGDEGKFEDWYTQFQAYADKHKYGDMLSAKARKDLPPEGQLTPREDMSKAQKKAFKHHNTALNEFSKIDWGWISRNQCKGFDQHGL
eukprot:jgi/Psemu1/53614/gm1.53614_g